MKTIFVFVILVYGVFDALTNEVKTVMEGDSVTLHTNLTELQTDVKIYWYFGPVTSSKPLVEIDGNQPPYPDFPDFKDRLQIDRKTGDLTIMNMRPKHTGPYRAEIDTADGKIPKAFKVTVYNVPRVINPAADEVKSVSVSEGESVTLHTDVTELQRHDLIVWRFGDEGLLIAKHDKEDNNSPEYDDVPDKRFSGKLQMDDKTGDLIIIRTTTQHTGVYKVKISNKKHKTFNVVVHAGGLSPGAMLGISLLVIAAAAAVVLGLIYYHHRITKPQPVTVKVFQAEDLILTPDDKDMQTADEGEWRFGDKEIIAKFNKKNNTFQTYDNVLDERFKGRLELNRQTGSLTIRNIKLNHSGLYKLKTSGRIITSYVHYNVIVMARDESVQLGGSVTLKTGVKDIKTDDEILWTFGPEDTRIARITGGINEPSYYNYTDGRFTGRLEMNNETGDLKIRDITAEHIGVYEVQTYIRGETRYKKFTVITSARNRGNESANVDIPLLNKADPAE